MTTQLELMNHAQKLATCREQLADVLRALHGDVETLRQQSMPAVRQAARRVAAEHNRLKELIEGNRPLFERPRTQVVAGLKYGLQKSKGKMSWAQDAQLIARIDKLIAEGELSAEHRALLVATTERPVAKALEQLDARTLKRLGVTVSADCDEVLIKSVDGEVEKAVAAVLKDLTKGDALEAAA
ncbi:hypothetical protein [Comamonas sp. NLF-1-9]|uniref:hypothetical protein n=1 Tax=Comamonas sp. NLF-1-9 TaxID=2853163 RepID=UPI001C45FD76|nr:hypothetical protein [Comamonas sp. NLF-1-9]QXL84104.1 hypothetical protein KUD94_12820 [Comamonas sp. NLF-1-9]